MITDSSKPETDEYLKNTCIVGLRTICNMLAQRETAQLVMGTMEDFVQRLTNLFTSLFQHLNNAPALESFSACLLK